MAEGKTGTGTKEPHKSGRERLRELSGNERWKHLFPPLKDERAAMEDLRKDLAEVPVLAIDGTVTNTYDKLEAENLSRKDKDLIWHCLALVRRGLYQAGRRGRQPQCGLSWRRQSQR
ncbi:MAG: hypothetical protein IPM93_22360 [Candidatus Obscuribacter sp.]|nr:hypothetical protein [Candidatus Obscuribacter sp.]